MTIRFCAGFLIITPWKVSKCGVFSGPLSTDKYGSEKTPYLDTFHSVNLLQFARKIPDECEILIIWLNK